MRARPMKARSMKAPSRFVAIVPAVATALAAETAALVAGAAALVAGLGPVGAVAQQAAETAGTRVTLEDVTVRAGLSAGGYWGNLSSVAVVWTDPTERAFAGTGSFELGGEVRFRGARREVRIDFDGGLWQYATGGFELRNYAPREYNGIVAATYEQRLWGGLVSVAGQAEARGVADRPPMPLYLQPGYNSYVGRVLYTRDLSLDGLVHKYDVEGRFENRDFAAPRVLPQLDLLDRSSGEAKVDLTRYLGSGYSALRVYGAFRYHSYPRKGLSIRRRDKAGRAGIEWIMDWNENQGLLVEASVGGIFNRSNSRRVEYNLIGFQGSLVKTLGLATDLLLDLEVKRKSYLTPGQYLVPGEEVDDLTLIQVGLARTLGPIDASPINATLRAYWKKAETNISGAFYRNLGVSFSMSATPWGR